VAAYEKAGGSASIFINDDGLQLMDPEAQLRRIRFYRQHNIGYVPTDNREELRADYDEGDQEKAQKHASSCSVDLHLLHSTRLFGVLFMWLAQGLAGYSQTLIVRYGLKECEGGSMQPAC